LDVIDDAKEHEDLGQEMLEEVERSLIFRNVQADVILVEKSFKLLDE